MNTDTNTAVLERLSNSRIYRDYERAFCEATGLPLRLSPVEDLGLTPPRRRRGSPICALLAKQSKACAACLRTRDELAGKAHELPATVTCFAGLCESAIPVRIGENLIGYLRTGEVLTHPPTQRHFTKIARQLLDMGLKVDTTELRAAYSRTRVLAPKQYESVVQLLRVFAQHLAIVAHQIVFRSAHAEPPGMTRAREFIDANHAEDLSLATVAKVVHMSTFYFCKQFKKATGVSFTNYLGRVRIERAKQMLLDPHARISEVAFACGFQSLTHFNRVFRKLAGESPSAYRTMLPLAQAA
ncbi:MAG: helix-turn-helix domain-containing protein [Chthoniobacteraceae bacterium]